MYNHATEGIAVGRDVIQKMKKMSTFLVHLTKYSIKILWNKKPCKCICPKSTSCRLPLTLYIGWTAGSCRSVDTQITSTTKCVRSRCDNNWKTWNSAWRTHILANNQARGGSLGRNMGVSLSGFCSSWKEGRGTIRHFWFFTSVFNSSFLDVFL